VDSLVRTTLIPGSPDYKGQVVQAAGLLSSSSALLKYARILGPVCDLRERMVYLWIAAPFFVSELQIRHFSLAAAVIDSFDAL
jgi:hypothetical protein